MNLFQAISDFFELIFNRNSPEVQKKLQLKKLENEIKAFQPSIFANGDLTGNFAETIRLLYVNSKPLNNLFLSTIGSPDGQRAHRFEAQLVLTGYKNEEQLALQKLSYDGRIQELNESSMTTSQIFDRQQRTFNKIIQQLGNENFRKIDKNLNMLRQLSDLCKFNFVTILQAFDNNFIAANPSYIPNYQPIAVSNLTNALEDLYYQTKGLVFTGAMINAIAALAQLHSHGDSSIEEVKSLKSNVKTIAFILTNILSPDKLKTIIRYGRQDLSYEPKSVTYKDSACHNFEQMMQSRFKSDEQRIKTEMNDENIRSELSLLFGDIPLVQLEGYNNEFNQKLITNSQASFLWILPLEIIKTFLNIYLTEPIRSLLNDIVIEGFFNNPSYKTEFSADVYAALETSQNIAAFEEEFSSGRKYSTAVLDSYIRDGKNDIDFLKKLDSTIAEINAEANKIIAKESNALYKIYKHIGDLLNDAKKPTSEIISNLKVLMMSSRNRDNTDQLEQQYGRWEIFFKIMKNYAIISS